MQDRREEPLVVVDHVYQKIDGKMYLVPVYEQPEAPESFQEEEEEWPMEGDYYYEEPHPLLRKEVAIGVGVITTAGFWIYAAPPLLDWTSIRIDLIVVGLERLGRSLLDLLGLALMYVVPTLALSLLVLHQARRGRKTRTEDQRPARPDPGGNVTINNITINRFKNEE